MKRYIIFVFVFLFLKSGYSQLTPSETKMQAQYLHIFCKYIMWPEEDTIKVFKIGVLGNNEIVPEIEKIIGLKNLKKKHTEVVYFKHISDIQFTHVLFISKDYNSKIEKIKKLIKDKYTLIVTEQCKDFDRIMINFLDFKNPQKYEVNSKNIKYTGFVIDDQLILHGGTITDLKKIYRKCRGLNTEPYQDEKWDELEKKMEELK